MAVTTFGVTKQMMVDYLTGAANPGDLHIPIGKWSANAYRGRALLYAPVSFSGMTSINSATLWLHAHAPAGGPFHGRGTLDANIYADRKTADWSETSHGQSDAVDELWGGNGAYLVTGDYVDVEAGDFGTLPDMGDAVWYPITVTEVVRRWFEGQPNYGIMLYNATSEDNSSYVKEFWSRHAAGSEPYISIDYGTNSPPNAPVNLSPSGTGVHTGRTITYSYQHSDPDGGSPALSHWELYQVGTKIDESYRPAGEQAFARTLPAGYDANLEYNWRVRTMDASGTWGPFSALQYFRPNTPPNSIAVNTPATNTLTPVISGGFSDPDPGNTMAAVRYLVYKYQVNWQPHADSGELATGAPWAHGYVGPALVWDEYYHVMAMTKDQWGAWSPWGPWTTWQPLQPTGPTLTPNTTAVKQNDATPDLTITHGSAFTDHELELRAYPAQAPFWVDTPAAYGATTSKVVTAPALSPGQVYEYRARVTVAGVWSVWSGWAVFRVNANPTAAVASVVADLGGAQTILTGGVYVTTDPTPKIVAPFSDPDKALYGDAPSARHFHVRRKDTQALHQEVTTGTAEEWTLTTPLLADVVYQVRVGYRDNAGWPAGTYVYSAWQDLKYSEPPVGALVDPPNAGVIGDSTPLLDWTYTSPSGKVQASYRVRILDKGPTGANYANEAQVLDTGTQAGTSTSHQVLPGVLLADHDYRWEVTVKDVDGLAHVLT